MRRKKTILLSAYACEPNKGSEPEVGWQWAINLSKLGHSVYVVTRRNNRKNIDKSKKKNENLNFIYYDLHPWLMSLLSRKGKPNLFSFLYFYFWQLGIFFHIRPYIKKIKFDYIHHVTFVSLRYPSFLCFYKIPFILGPVSGGETVDFKFYKSLNLRSKIFEIIRNFSKYLIKYSPLINIMIHKSKKILVTSNETKNLIPKRYHFKTKIMLAISSDGLVRKKNLNKSFNSYISICFVGRLLCWKGIGMTLDILYKLKTQIRNLKFTIIGDGLDKTFLQKKIDDLSLNNSIKIIKNQKRDTIMSFYKSQNLLLFPSYRDSGGMVIFEAISSNLLVASLNLSGPGYILNTKSSILIDPKNLTYDEIVQRFSEKIVKCFKNHKLYKKKIKYSQNIIKNFNMISKISKIYN